MPCASLPLPDISILGLSILQLCYRLPSIFVCMLLLMAMGWNGLGGLIDRDFNFTVFLCVTFRPSTTELHSSSCSLVWNNYCIWQHDLYWEQWYSWSERCFNRNVLYSFMYPHSSERSVSNTGSNDITACSWHFFNAHNAEMESPFYLNQSYVIVHKMVIACMKLQTDRSILDCFSLCRLAFLVDAACEARKLQDNFVHRVCLWIPLKISSKRKNQVYFQVLNFAITTGGCSANLELGWE